MMETFRFWKRKFVKSCFHKRNLLTFATLGGVAIGISVGVVLKNFTTLSEDTKSRIYYPAELMFRMLSLVSVPLFASNVILGTCGAVISPSRKIATRTLIYIAVTTFLALLTGVLLVQVLKPGDPGTHLDVEEEYNDGDEAPNIQETILTLLWNWMPRNFIEMSFRLYQIRRFLVNVESDDFNTTQGKEERRVRIDSEDIYGANIMGVIVWSFFVGMVCRSLRRNAEILMECAYVFNLVMKGAVKLIMYYLPIGAAFLSVSYIYEVADNWQLCLSVVKFVAVVIGGVVFHGVIVLPLIYLLVTRRNPFHIIRGVSPALLKALLVSRIFAARRTYKCCEGVLKLDRRITRYFLPIASHVNVDGTAMYEVAAVLFIAQLNGLTLYWNKILTICLTVAVATVGDMGVPPTGMSTTLFVLSICGIPAKDASVLMAIEWMIDRLNAVINVLGDCFGAALVEHLSQKELQETGEEPTAAREEDTPGPSRT